MEVTAYLPNHPILKETIDCIYFLKRTKEEPPTAYFTFPTLNSILSVSTNTRIYRGVSRDFILHDPSQPFYSSLVTRFKRPFCFEYQGEINEITIYFKPLGINAFFRKPLNSYPEGIDQSFVLDSNFEKEFTEILNRTSDLEKLKGVEDYLLSLHQSFQHSFLPTFVNALLDDTMEGLSLAELASKYAISQKTIIKHFQQHLCKTPSEFRKIARFRKALQKFNQQEVPLSLTELTYILNYFDQSHLVKEFKELTGFSPKTFFKQISPLENGTIQWMFTSNG